MSFANMPIGWVAAGLAGLAGLLYVLQRLRVRHRTVTVVTTLFWRSAAEEAPARTFRERFRHPWAYLLFLAIAALLWLAFAGPQAGAAKDGAFHVLVIDGSAGMAAGTRFDDAVAALKDAVSRYPASERQVLWCGAGVRTLLSPGEHALLLEKRLEGLRPEAAPAGVESLLRQLAASGRPGRAVEVMVFGDAPVRKKTLELMPKLRVTRAPVKPRDPQANSGITALGVAAAESGAWDKVDVYLRAEGGAAPISADRLHLEIDGRQIPSSDLRSLPADRGGGFLLANVPAAGGLLSVTINGEDALSFDNVARLRLPEKPRVRVLLSPALASQLRPVLEADPAVELTDVAPSVVVRAEGEAIGSGLPALEFIASSDSRPAFTIVHPEGFDSARVFAQAVDAIGLREIDAMTLAETAGRPVEATVASGSQWKFDVWRELLGEDYNFTQSRAFPLFMANAVRWLANVRDGYPVVAAGQPLVGGPLEETDKVVDKAGRAVDPVGVPYVPERAGELHVNTAPHPLEVALLDAPTTLAMPGAIPDMPRQLPSAVSSQPVMWLLLLALILLVWEWFLYQSGRIP